MQMGGAHNATYWIKSIGHIMSVQYEVMQRALGQRPVWSTSTTYELGDLSTMATRRSFLKHVIAAGGVGSGSAPPPPGDPLRRPSKATPASRALTTLPSDAKHRGDGGFLSPSRVCRQRERSDLLGPHGPPEDQFPSSESVGKRHL